MSADDGGYQNNPHIGTFHRVRCIKCGALFIALYRFSRCGCGYLNDVGRLPANQPNQQKGIKS